MIPAAHLLITSFLKLITFIVCSLKNSRNVFTQFLALYVSCLIFMLLRDDVVAIEKPDEVCSLTFVVDDFSGLSNYCQIFYID